MSKTRLRELFISGHISYREYMAELNRLDEARERLYELCLEGKITFAELRDMLSRLDRTEGELPKPPTIY